MCEFFFFHFFFSCVISKHRDIPRSVHIAEIVNDKLSTFVILFFECDSTVVGITEKVQTVLNSDAPITLTDSQGN